MKLLIIEDEESLRRSIVDYLTREGNICDIAPTFDQAIEKVNLYDYDCILLDLGLPDGEGLELLRSLKKIKRQDGVGWLRISMMELRYGHYSRSTGLASNVISFNIKVK